MAPPGCRKRAKCSKYGFLKRKTGKRCCRRSAAPKSKRRRRKKKKSSGWVRPAHPNWCGPCTGVYHRGVGLVAGEQGITGHSGRCVANPVHPFTQKPLSKNGRACAKRAPKIPVPVQQQAGGYDDPYAHMGGYEDNYDPYADMGGYYY